jgi:hypothetical protein
VVDQELLARNEYLAAENHILKAKLKWRLTATANRPILAPDERSLQVDLVRLDRTVPGAGLRQIGAWDDPRGAGFRAQIGGEPRDSEKRAQFRKRSSRSRHAVSSVQGSRGPT